MAYSIHLKKTFITKKMLRCILFAGVPAVLFDGFSVVGLRTAGFDLIEILRDPAQQNGQSSFLGFVSNIGVWLWVSSAAILFYSTTTGGLVAKCGQRELLLLVGVLSTVLAVDDFFMIHDRYVNQKICYLTYAVYAGFLLIRHYKTIIEIEGFAFLLACLLLALSILTDLSQNHIPLSYSYVQVFEEGFKFVGGAIWLYFSFRIASFRATPSRAGSY
jgi:hypothetical protein